MQYITRSNVLPHKAEELRDWLKKYDKLLHEGQSPGWKYLGAWFTVHSLGQYDFEMRFEIDDYAALGTGFGNEEMQKAWLEIYDAFAPNVGETCLMKSAEDVWIMKGT
jgi:hypothetical protein